MFMIKKSHKMRAQNYAKILFISLIWMMVWKLNREVTLRYNLLVCPGTAIHVPDWWDI